MSSIYSWSTTADDNDDSDININWQENQLPDTVNNSGRAMMGRVEEYVLDQGTNLVGGTADAMTLTANSAFAAYANGLRLTIKAASTNTTAVNLNVNSLGNKALRKVFRGAVDVPLGAGDIQQGGVYELIYDAAANSAAGAWIVVNPALGAVATGSVVSIAQGGSGQITAALAMDAFGATRTITAGDGLSGGGTLAADRTIDLGTPATLTASTTNGVTASSHTHAITGFVPTTTSITAGNGMTGGGALSTDRTLTLGTPATLTMSTTNGVTANSHTHALSGVAGVVNGGVADETDFPLGHVIVVIGDGVTRNGGVNACLHTNNNFYTVVGEPDDSTPLVGTWRCRGGLSTLNHMLVQRVA
jgi:hypothetical protein